MKILLGACLVGALALSAFVLLVYQQVRVEEGRLAKWRAYCAERTATPGESDQTRRMALNQWLDSTSVADRILITLVSFDIERRGHPKDYARSQAVMIGFSWATRDQASPTLKAHPDYVAKETTLTRIVRDVLAGYRGDIEHQRSFASYFKESVGEELDPLVVEGLYREHPSIAAVREEP